MQRTRTPTRFSLSELGEKLRAWLLIGKVAQNTINTQQQQIAALQRDLATARSERTQSQQRDQKILSSMCRVCADMVSVLQSFRLPEADNASELALAAARLQRLFAESCDDLQQQLELFGAQRIDAEIHVPADFKLFHNAGSSVSAEFPDFTVLEQLTPAFIGADGAVLFRGSVLVAAYEKTTSPLKMNLDAVRQSHINNRGQE